MSLTRAGAETLLIRRLGKLLTEAGLDGTTLNGSNADLADPLGWAVRQCGGSVANIANVADTDLAGIAASDTDKLLDLAEYRTLQSLSTSPVFINIQVGSRREDLSKLADMIDKRLERKLAQLQQDYDFGIGGLEGGVIALDFMSKGGDDDD
jgi:hypothetical protein